MEEQPPASNMSPAAMTAGNPERLFMVVDFDGVGNLVVVAVGILPADEISQETGQEQLRPQ